MSVCQKWILVYSGVCVCLCTCVSACVYVCMYILIKINLLGSKMLLHLSLKRLTIQKRDHKGMCAMVVCVHHYSQGHLSTAYEDKLFNSTSSRTTAMWGHTHNSIQTVNIVFLALVQALQLLRTAKMIQEALRKREGMLENLQSVLVQIQMAETDAKVGWRWIDTRFRTNGKCNDLHILVHCSNICCRFLKHIAVEQLHWGHCRKRHH